MRVLYVAKHGCGDNDDEGAIAHALREHGVDVRCCHEKATVALSTLTVGCDFLLFHKWEHRGELAAAARLLPCVFWYFDLVDSDDPSLAPRCEQRVRWFALTLPYCARAFCTDGDWVARDTTGKLRHLMQGADGRTAGRGTARGSVPPPPLLFAGMVRHGLRRASHIAELAVRYGPALEILGDAGPRRRLHGRALADHMAGRVVLAPDGPSTDRYWSNRVYQALGFSAFLLHPACAGLREHYTPEELVTYGSREELHWLVERYLDRPREREAAAEAGHARTLREHLYTHRVGQLLEEMRR